MTKIKAEEIFKLKNINKRWKWITKDKNGLIYIYNIKPILIRDYWTMHDEGFCISNFFNDLELDFGTDDWTKCIAERPIDYNKYIGKLGIFADCEEELNLKSKNIYILSSVANRNNYNFVDVNGYIWKYFRPLTKEEIEQLTNYGE